MGFSSEPFPAQTIPGEAQEEGFAGDVWLLAGGSPLSLASSKHCSQGRKGG